MQRSYPAEGCMAILPEGRLLALLAPYLDAALPAPQDPESTPVKATEREFTDLAPRLVVYLDLLLKWNRRTNLTSIRDPEEMARRHFGESLFAARVLAHRLGDGAAVLDIGSGAGFPGLPVQLLLPKVHVVLAESQGKKAAFLREVIRATAAGVMPTSEAARKIRPHRTRRPSAPR